ncbi:Transposase DDE domain protein [Leptospira santarosai]|uniref:Transposase DDE domain protein n=1 Tax=Leptospira santarosai TaxID=28183 RepID=A0A2P1QVC0_9LEPT|nr:Transposase DDE domain protein [Leptospira santarosai]
MRFYPLLGLISLSSFELFFVISKILSLHRFSFQFDSCFFLFRRKSQFFRDDYVSKTQSNVKISRFWDELKNELFLGTEIQFP